MKDWYEMSYDEFKTKPNSYWYDMGYDLGDIDSFVDVLLKEYVE